MKKLLTEKNTKIMNIDIDKVTGGDPVKKEILEKKLQIYTHEAYIKWKKKTIARIARVTDIVDLLLLVIVWFINIDWLQWVCICSAVVLLIFGIVHKYLEKKFVETIVHDKVEPAMARIEADLKKRAEMQLEVAPELWEQYCKIQDEVNKRAEEMARQDLGDKYGLLGTCHYVWHYKKKILKEEYNIDWKSPAELNPNTYFD